MSRMHFKEAAQAPDPVAGYLIITVRNGVMYLMKDTGVEVAIGGNIAGLPNGGIAGDLLVKQTAADGDALWASTLNKIALNTAGAYVAPSQGELVWNSDEGTIDAGLNGGTSVLQLGQEVLYRVENVTGSTITNGTLCVYAGTVGASGKLRVAPWTGAELPFLIMGIATEDIADGAFGYVTHFGKVHGINTTGSIYGETWNIGDILWADASGGLTNVEPEAPDPKTRIAIVVNSHSTVGTLFVKVTTGSSLANDDLVELSALLNGDALVYNDSTNRFENANLPNLYEKKRKHNLTATTDPAGANNASEGYEPLSKWINTVSGEIFIYVSETGGVADWQQHTLTIDELGSAALEDSSAFDPAGSAASAQAYALQRDNHTGTQTLSTISDAGTAAAQDIEYFVRPTGDTIDDVTITEYTETVNAAAGATLDRGTGGIQRLNLTANTTLNLSGLSAGQSVMYRVTGGTTYTLGYTGLGAWSNGLAPTLSATHYLEFVHDGVEVVGFDCRGR